MSKKTTVIDADIIPQEQPPKMPIQEIPNTVYAEIEGTEIGMYFDAAVLGSDICEQVESGAKTFTREGETWSVVACFLGTEPPKKKPKAYETKEDEFYLP